MSDSRGNFGFKNLPIQDLDIAGGDKALKKNDTNSDSATVKTAKLYIYGWLCYNACFPCLPNYCGNKFCIKKRDGTQWDGGYFIELRRSVWLRLLHALCFCLHITFVVITLVIAGDGDMLVTVKRVRPYWGVGTSYFHDIQPSKNQFVYIDTLTVLFFGCSAFMHSMWLVMPLIHPSWADRMLWGCLDKCLCWWRWAEYSLSASTMMIAIAITTGIADQNTLLGIFALGFITMWCGYFTELVSRPAKNADGTVNYDRWEGDPDPLENDATKEEKRAHLMSRITNYAYRMFPHVIGIIPYSVAWFIIVNGWNELMDDLTLCSDSDGAMPEWVPFLVYGCFTVFSFFTFVQWRYQWIAPEHYWRTEIWYCILSATAKILLGQLLLLNVFSKTVDDDEQSHICTEDISVDEKCNATIKYIRWAATGCDSRHSF